MPSLKRLMNSDHELVTVVTRPDDNGTFVAYVPAIPGCHAWGRTFDEARTELAHVFDMIKDEYAANGRSLPRDVELSVSREH